MKTNYKLAGLALALGGGLTFGAASADAADAAVMIHYLVVGGGGAGGAGTDSPGNRAGGGGGAGGLLTNVGGSLLSVDEGSYTVTVGDGGAAPTAAGNRGSQGGDSSIFGAGLTTITAFGGGGGAGSNQGAAIGGSGGGGANNGPGADGTTGQGFQGGNGGSSGSGGGGGGAGAAGENAPGSNIGGKGGDGLQNAITGTLTYYAGGGGGRRSSLGGLGGGGDAGVAGTDGLGGGGGGATGFGAIGGSGIVILSYDTSQSLFIIGGDYSTYEDGGITYAVHQFTSVGDTEFTISAIPEPSSSFPFTITPATPPATGYDFEWASQPGKLYDLLTSTDLADPIDEWPIYDDGDSETSYEAIPADGDTTTLTAVPSTDPRRFFAMREYDAPPPPPLLEENFEDVVGPAPPAGWTRTDNGAGTVWEVGTPDGIAEFIPNAAAVGTQCVGTNINAQYTASADASLISPAFNVPETGATLDYWQYIDTEASPSGDLGSIRLLNAADDSFLADVVTGIEGITTSWSEQSVELPAAANGVEVKLEFRFTSDASETWGGFYIDDILVTAN